MKKIYLIVGHGSCGKSSLVRALTGIFRGCRTRVSDIDGNDLKFRVWVRSAQEAEKSPIDVLEEINDCLDPNVLLTLRFHSYNGMPQAIDYVRLIEQYHDISKIIFLSGDETPISFTFPNAQIEMIGNSWSNAVNANAAKARKFLRWN